MISTDFKPHVAAASPSRTALLACFEQTLLFLQGRLVLPGLYLLLIAPSVLLQVYLTPPIQVADEEHHFARASMILNGQVFGRVIADGDSGGYVDPAVATFAYAFGALQFKKEVKINPAVYDKMSRLRWREGPVQAFSFANTAIYPFFLYLPASTGLAVGRAARLSLMDSFYLGRLSTALVGIVLSTLAIWLCGQGRGLVFVILSLPMTSSLFASVSQDAMLIALSAVATALWAQYAAQAAPMPVWTRMSIAVALGAVIAGRLPLAPLFGLALIPTHRLARFAWPRSLDVAAVAAGLIPLSIGIYGAHVAKVPFRVDDGVSATAQWLWMIHHPASAAAAVGRTVLEQGWAHTIEMIGVLGWIDTLLPSWCYRLVRICAVLVFLLDSLKGRVFLPVWGLVPLVAALLAFLGMVEALYMNWTPVGAALVEGLQGRYFIIPALVLAVSLPGLRVRLSSRASVYIQVCQPVLCGVLAVVNLWAVPITLLHRYYG